MKYQIHTPTVSQNFLVHLPPPVPISVSVSVTAVTIPVTISVPTAEIFATKNKYLLQEICFPGNIKI